MGYILHSPNWPSFRCTKRMGGKETHLFSAGFTPTDKDAMAVTVSASSFSHFCASIKEYPTVEA